MKQNYFMYNGKKYETGTVLKIKSYRNTNEVHKVIFNYANSGYYTYKDATPYGRNGATIPEKVFFELLVEVTEEKDMRVVPIKKKRNELEIDNMLIAWIWYIIITLFCSICTGGIVGVVICSIVFFKWRSKKIKEEGYYYERQI